MVEASSLKNRTKKITLPIAHQRKGFKKSHIGKSEWWMVIGALGFIDLIEFILGLFVIGEVANTFIDFAVGPSLAFYLFIRGEDLSSTKRIVSLVGSFGLELLPFVNDLPLWTLDGLYLMSLSSIQNKKTEREEKLENNNQKTNQENSAIQQRIQIEDFKAKRMEAQMVEEEERAV